MRVLISIFFLLCCYGNFASAQPSGCDETVGGSTSNAANTDCYNCQFIRDEHNVWDQETIAIITEPDLVVAEGLGAAMYNCTEGSTLPVSVTLSVTAVEQLTFAEGGYGGARLGLSAGLVADGSFGLSATSGESHAVRNTATADASLPAVPDCEGLAIEAEYTTFTRAGYLTQYALVTHYECDCRIYSSGFVLEDIYVVYRCYPQRIQAANSSLVKSSRGVWLRAAGFRPPRAPSEYSIGRCSYCDENNGGGGQDTLDPDGDEDGDGIPNSEDDTPYGYNGNDPDGDADGDGIPNKDDPTPYGYDGDDPDGDDDGDGIKNSMDPTPNGGVFKIFPIPSDPFGIVLLVS